LGSLVREYEALYHPLPALQGVELIKALLAELNLEAKDLVPIFNSENNAADILNNKRDLTVTEVQKLAKFFHVSPAVFLEQN
jgi:HTH-type transcriptional regulator/antitoxin HigA